MDTPNADRQISSIASLNEPVRRALYRYVVEQDCEVSRDQAAGALGISRALAVFHLDRLAEEGLLDVSFCRLTEKRGPGAGRPAKLYRRSSRQVDISLPPRSYELAARLLAAAVAGADSGDVTEKLAEIAHSFGEDIGTEARRHAGGTASPDRVLDAVQDSLSAYGFEPHHDGEGAIRLRNCPFHALAECHRSLVCGMNLALMRGVVDGLEAHDIEAVLDPQPGMCCVTFRAAPSGS